jgi:hypothetical protein
MIHFFNVLQVETLTAHTAVYSIVLSFFTSTLPRNVGAL